MYRNAISHANAGEPDRSVFFHGLFHMLVLWYSVGLLLLLWLNVTVSYQIRTEDIFGPSHSLQFFIITDKLIHSSTLQNCILKRIKKPFVYLHSICIKKRELVRQ